METFLKDLRYAARQLRKTPGFTAVAVLTLGLGIGANAAIFSAVNAVLLRPLPFKDPERLVLLSETVVREGVERRPLSYPDFMDWRDRNRVFESMAGFDQVSLTLAGEEPERVSGEMVSAEYFALLGAAPALGRLFLPEEDRVPGTHSVAILSYDLWRRRFGSDPDVVGRMVEVNDRHVNVIGIMPEGFAGLTDEAAMWLPMMLADLAGRADDLTDRGARWMPAIARLKPGVTLERAQAEMTAIARALEESYPADNAKRGALVLSLGREMFGNMRPALLILFSAVVFLLLMCCANLANLMLARAAQRSREMALRSALGAGRRRLAGQLLTESLLLAGAGGLLGLTLAFWGMDLLVALSPVELPSFARVGVDVRVLGFAVVLTLLTGVLFGLTPALAVTRPDLRSVLNEGGRSSTEGRSSRRTANALVTAQVALALVLLVGAGLMLRSLQRLRAVDPGFTAEDLVAFRVDLPPGDYPPEEAAAFAIRLVERLGDVAGVTRVAVASDTPLEGSISARMGTVESAEGEREFRFYHHSVSPGFFATLGVPLLAGRDFTTAEAAGAPVVIVGEELAHRFWAGGNPLSKRIRIGDAAGPWSTVVGVVGEVRHRALAGNPAMLPSDPDLYRPLSQNPPQSLSVTLQTQLQPERLLPALRHEVRQVDPDLPLYGIESLSDRLARETALSRFSAALLAAFACLALVLAALGIYGVLAYTVTQRVQEMGLRMALGARSGQILRDVVGRGLTLALAGIGLGLAGAFAVTRLLRTLLYDVSASDPATFLSVSLVLTAVALLASYIPARRATRVDPLVALRST